MKKKVAILGHFGGDELFLDGQTVKTKILYEELVTKTDWEIQKIDTYLKKKKPVRLLLDTIGALLQRKDIIVLLSVNGMRTFFPMLSFFARVWNIRVFHDVIGGNLDKYTLEYPRFKKYLNSFCVNWVETEILKSRLSEKGVTNCEVIPNFKRLAVLEEKDLTFEYKKPYRFCTFSRVMKEKGIEDAINAIEEINTEKKEIICSLDIYGVVDKTYESRFNEIVSKAPSYIHYCGVVDYDKSVNTIKDYFGLLFPTCWDGEGFPGTIVDAFSAGIPVIASDWNSNKEIIRHMKNGVLFPSEQIKELKDGIIFLIDKANDIKQIKLNCIKDAQKYRPDNYIRHIINEMEG